MHQMRRTSVRVLSVQFMESKSCQGLYIYHRGSRERASIGRSCNQSGTVTHVVFGRAPKPNVMYMLWQACECVLKYMQMHICSRTRKKNDRINDLFFFICLNWIPLLNILKIWITSCFMLVKIVASVTVIFHSKPSSKMQLSLEKCVF